MSVRQFEKGRVFLGRLDHDEDLLGGIERVARERHVRVGVFSVIGAVKEATIAFYDQAGKRYRGISRAEPLEIASCAGSLSLREGRIMAHAHAAFSAADGSALAGHLAPGTPVFAAEILLQELLGPDLVRRPDETTGLALWDLAEPDP